MSYFINVLYCTCYFSPFLSCCCKSHFYYKVEPRFNEPLFNKVLDITNNILCPGQSYSKMYGIEPWYNEFFDIIDIINIIRKPKRKIYLDITNYDVNMRQKINAEQINSQQILLILMVKRQQPFSQRLIISHRHWYYSISTSALNSVTPVLQINH